jgi:hypothetical protein
MEPPCLRGRHRHPRRGNREKRVGRIHLRQNRRQIKAGQPLGPGNIYPVWPDPAREPPAEGGPIWSAQSPSGADRQPLAHRAERAFQRHIQIMRRVGHCRNPVHVGVRGQGYAYQIAIIGGELKRLGPPRRQDQHRCPNRPQVSQPALCPALRQRRSVQSAHLCQARLARPCADRRGRGSDVREVRGQVTCSSRSCL